ncbi:tape measure protein [Glycomyces sp. NPDC048151]|uniref:tape measure protein n=1 Tax=Glycomyces sp. NPDC048151 TaxID=3364002 RepID=UPI0037102B73
MATGGAKFATGYIELTLLDSSMLKRAQSLTAQISRDIERNITRNLGAAFDRIGDRLTSLGGEATIAFAPVSLAVGHIVADGWEMAKSVSSARNIFHQFGMEASAATAFVDELYGKSNAWGTSFNTMLEGAIKLWPAFGGNVDEIRYAMEGLYNVTGKYHLSAEAVNGVIRAFVQIAQKGKIQAEEMLQISEWGVDSWGLFSRALGITTQELRDMTARGEALAEDVMPKVYQYLNENPEFAGKASAGIETMSGQLMILQNQLSFLIGGALADENTALVAAFKDLNTAIGTLIDSGFVAEFLTPIIAGFAAVTEWLAGMDGGTLALMAGLTLLAAVIGPLLLVAGRLFDHLGEGAEAVGHFNGRVVEGAKTLGGGFKRTFTYFVESWRTTPQPVGRAAQALDTAALAVAGFGDKVLHPVRTLSQFAQGTWNAYQRTKLLALQVDRVLWRAFDRLPDVISAGWDAVYRFDQACVRAAKGGVQAVRSGLVATWKAIPKTRQEFAALGSQTLKGLQNAALATGRGLRWMVQDGPAQAMMGLYRAAGRAADGLSNGLLNALTATSRGLARFGAFARGVATDALTTLGRNAGGIARKGLDLLRGGFMGAALAAGALLVSGVAIGPAVADAGDQVVAAIQNLPILAQELAVQLPGIIREAVGTLAQVLPALVDSLAEGGPLILQAIVDSLSILGQGAVQAAPTLLALAVGLVGQLASYLATNIPLLVDAFMGVFPQIVAGIGTAATSLVSAIVQLVPPLLTAIVNAIPVIVSGFVSLFPILVTGILGALPSLVSAFISSVPMLIESTVAAIPSIVESVVSMVPAIISTLVPMLPQIVVALLLLVPQILTAVIGAIPSIVRTVVGMIPQIASALIDALPEAVDAFMELVPELLDAWKDAGSAFKDIGRELVDWVIDGLSSAWGSVSSWVSDQVSNIDLNPFSASDLTGLVGLETDTSGVSAALSPLAATYSIADAASAVSAFDASTLAGAADSLATFDLDTSVSVPNVAVRVYLGDQELTDLVRTEIRVLDERDAAFAAAGAR